MNILFLNRSFNKTLPNSICTEMVITEAVNRGHRCMLVTSEGVVFDSSDNLGYRDVVRCGAKKSSYVQFIDKAFFYFTWPNLYSSSHKTLVRNAIDVIETFKPDVVVGSVLSVESAIACSEIKNMYRNSIKVILYCLDSILGGPTPSMFTDKQHDAKAIRFENKYFINADKIIMMKAAERKYTELTDRLKFSDKISYLDLPLYIPEKSQLYNILESDSKTINLLYAGSLPKNIRNPRFFLDSFCKINNRNIHLFIAGRSDYDDTLKMYANINPNIHLLGLITRTQVEDYMRKAHILINIGNSMPYMMPCKIFEYMSTGKPIISTIKCNDDISVQYFDWYNRALVLSEASDINVAGEKMNKFISEISIINHLPIQDDYLYNNRPSTFVDLIESINE